jgi:hypothetical protein
MFDQILSILFPERCYGCHKSGTPLCAACVERIPYSFPILESLPCFAFFNYSDHLVQYIVRDLKYHRRSSAAKRSHSLWPSTVLRIFGLHITEFRAGDRCYSARTATLYENA